MAKLISFKRTTTGAEFKSFKLPPRMRVYILSGIANGTGLYYSLQDAEVDDPTTVPIMIERADILGNAPYQLGLVVPFECIGKKLIVYTTGALSYCVSIICEPLRGHLP